MAGATDPILATGRQPAPAAARARRAAEAIAGAFAPCEKACLDIGARLGDAIPGLSEFSGLFATLSQSLDSEQMRAAGRDLQAVADEIEANALALGGESRALDDLVALNLSIAERIVTLTDSGRMIAMLVFNVKIEAASLSDAGEDLRAFVAGLHQLAQRAQQALEQYRQTHAKLYVLLRASGEAQKRFQESHQAQLQAISGEIAASVAALADRRGETSAALSDIGARSQSVGAKIGQCVMALQVGDSTCQRIDHVCRALGLAADGLETDAGEAMWADFGEIVGAATRDAAVAWICRLQSRQLGAAVNDFVDESDKIAQALQGLLADAAELAACDRALFGTREGGCDSFIETLKRRLQAARAIMNECRRAHAEVDRAAAAAAATMVDLEQRTAGLSEIIVDVTMIGTNALLKASRLGERGKGLSVIAQELRAHAAGIVEGVETLPAALREVAAFVERFSGAGRAGGADGLDALDARMLGAIEAFQANGETMADALARLDRETAVVDAMLREAAGQLAGDAAEICASLWSAVAEVDSIAAEVEAGESGVGADILDGLVRGAYTMAIERQVHDAFLAEAGAGAPAEDGDELWDSPAQDDRRAVGGR